MRDILKLFDLRMFFGSNVEAPVQSNESQIKLQNRWFQQYLLQQKQAYETQKANWDSWKAEVKNDEDLAIRKAKAEVQKADRKRRMEKGNRDLLFGTGMGVRSEQGKRRPLLLLGGY